MGDSKTGFSIDQAEWAACCKNEAKMMQQFGKARLNPDIGYRLGFISRFHYYLIL